MRGKEGKSVYWPCSRSQPFELALAGFTHASTKAVAGRPPMATTRLPQQAASSSPANDTETAYSTMPSYPSRPQSARPMSARSQNVPQRNPNQSMYASTFNARDDNPEIYAKAMQFLKSEPTPNYTLISEWGDSLRKANDSEWRKKFFMSIYTSANEDVVDTAYEKENNDKKDKAFYEW
jgi:hypothetical protein